MELGILPTLTKDYILRRITQEEIMSFYLQVPINLNELIVCPPVVRRDKNPTFGFYYNNQGRLRGRDFGGAFWGDCFDAVALVIGTNVRTKKGFNLILHTIAKDFRIHKYKDAKEVSNYNKITKNYFEKAKKKKKPKTIFKIVPRNYNYHDEKYWSSFNVNYKLLQLGRVYFPQEIYISKDNLDFTKIYSYNPKDPAYAYFGGKDILRIDNWKIYYPLRRKGEIRFHSNSSFLQGKHLITCGRFAGITKAYKDVLSFRSFGIQTVAPSAESVLINYNDYFFIKRNFNYLFSCMDYDDTGKRMAIMLKRKYNIIPIMFTNKYKVKDFAEYVNKYGVQRTHNLLKSVYNRHIDDLNDIDKYNYHILKNIK